MCLTLSVEHIEQDGRGTLCAAPTRISLSELGVIKADVFRWLDSTGMGPRLNDLRANQVVVKDTNDGVMFSAFRT